MTNVKRNTYWSSVGKTEVKCPLRNPRFRRNITSKCFLKMKRKDVEWINLTRGSDKWQAVV
jgi:hypothetical protein